MKVINHYSHYIRKKYGERVQKITVLGGFTCPNRDGTKSTGGCTFCNNETFAAPKKIAELSITEQIDHGIKTAKRRYKVDKFIVYFQSYSNTYAPLERLQLLYEEALSHPQVIGLSIGTRADCIDQQKLDYLQSLTKRADITLELGIESIFDNTLIQINRGHDYQVVKEAFIAAQNRGIDLCGHLILGFPWETQEQIVESAQEISSLPLNSLKLHQLHIVKGTEMEKQLINGEICAPTMEEYRCIVTLFLKHLSPEIAIQRLCGEAPKHLLASPSWNSSTSEFTQLIEKELVQNGNMQGQYHIGTR